MKNFIKIIMILWGAFCGIGILGNFQKYGLSEWITVIAVVSIPFVIMIFLYKKIKPQNTKPGIPEPVDVLTPTYIETEDSIYKVDGTAITDEEIPHIIEITKENAMSFYDKSTNPKFHRTDKEKILSMNFSDKYFEQIQMIDDAIFTSVNAIGDTGKKWLKQASKQDILDKITLCDTAINVFEKSKQYCYKKGKGGTIYFQDSWEYCHNSKNECFSFIDNVIQTKSELEKLL